MIVILASEFDTTADSLARRWSRGEATLLTPNDAAGRGWRISLEDPQSSEFVAGGRPRAARDVRGVISRLTGIVPRELYRIAAEDQAYAALEITALLVYWLNQLECPVLNRPSPHCLAGPGLRFEQWVLLAAECGIPVQPFTRSTAAGHAEERLNATVHRALVIGGRCVAGDERVRGSRAAELAKRAGVGLLEVRFLERGNTEVFDGINLLPDLSTETARCALEDYFATGRR